jgi:hypothetical protein
MLFAGRLIKAYLWGYSEKYGAKLTNYGGKTKVRYCVEIVTDNPAISQNAPILNL